jgi:hypothetical protein
VLVYFASLVVLIINILIEKTIKLASSFEKPHTADEQGMSVFLRIFVLKYINTAAVFFISNDNVILRKVFGLHTSSRVEFDPTWFNQVGTTIILVQLGEVVNAHAPRLFNLIKFYRNKHLACSNPGAYLTQDDLNKAFAGPPFEFASNYAQLLSTFFVCLTFSTGIPLLYPLAAANFWVFYFIEKYHFMRVYRIPPHFNTMIGKRATALVPVALGLHLIMAIWVLSNNSLFSSNVDSRSAIVHSSVFGQTIATKITHKATFPLFITLCALGFARVMMSVVGGFWQSIKQVS